MKKVVIVGSASLQENIQYRKKFREDKGYSIINYPAPIPEENFLEEYPGIHTKFFKDITKTDILFVMNENKNDII